jgi:hypothetical protein
MGTNVSEEPAICIFSLKMETADSSGMFILTYQTTWDDISGGHKLNIKTSLREIVKNYIDRAASRIFLTAGFAVNRF